MEPINVFTNCLPQDPNLSHFNPVHTLILYSFKIYFNILLPSASTFPFPYGFPD